MCEGTSTQQGGNAAGLTALCSHSQRQRQSQQSDKDHPPNDGCPGVQHCVAHEQRDCDPEARPRGGHRHRRHRAVRRARHTHQELPDRHHIPVDVRQCEVSGASGQKHACWDVAARVARRRRSKTTATHPTCAACASMHRSTFSQTSATRYLRALVAATGGSITASSPRPRPSLRHRLFRPSPGATCSGSRETLNPALAPAGNGTRAASVDSRTVVSRYLPDRRQLAAVGGLFSQQERSS
jgi:hypothetical protein